MDIFSVEVEVVFLLLSRDIPKKLCIRVTPNKQMYRWEHEHLFRNIFIFLNISKKDEIFENLS